MSSSKAAKYRADNSTTRGEAPVGEIVYHNSVDWVERHHPPARRFLTWLERLSLAVERPINKLIGESQFNPLYHTGTITVFLLLVILFTGIYLTMFFQFGFAASYAAVGKVEASFVGRIVRAVHRYASGTAVLTTLLHGWRTLFQDRFRGARWLAWVSGVVMAAFLWFTGITGYWLIWDERAQLINQTLINILQNAAAGQSFLINYLTTEAAGTGWIFILLVLTVHVLLAIIIGLVFWYLHVKRLNRPKILPPRYWMGVVGGLLFLAAILIPVGMLPAADPTQLPGQVTVDSFYLFYLPAALNGSPALLWGGVTLLLVVLSAIPWLLVRPSLSPIVVSEERCTGCTLCAEDCPYRAFTMVPRSDGHPHKYLAVVDPDLCVSCGVCIGSCPTMALTLGKQPAEPLWETAVARAAQTGDNPVKVIFTCERHALQGARPYLAGNGRHTVNSTQIEVVPLTCIGMAHPDLAVQALQAGASEVQFIGCPPEDCANREGNLWLAQRLERERLPKLKKAYRAAPITADWLPPNEFVQGLSAQKQRAWATTYGHILSQADWRAFIPALALMVIVLAAQVWLSDVPYRPHKADQSFVEIAMTHRNGYLVQDAATAVSPDPNPSAPTRLLLEVDGQVALDEVYAPQGKQEISQIYEQAALPPGRHHLRLTLFDRADAAQGQLLFEETVTLAKGQALPLHFVDARTGSDPAAGEALYDETSLGTNAACRICHSLQPDVTLVGPSFHGIATRAGERVPGMSAEAYLHQSIVDPDAYVVEGFPSGQMIPNLAEILTEEQIDDLIAFLLTLE